MSSVVNLKSVLAIIAGTVVCAAPPIPVAPRLLTSSEMTLWASACAGEMVPSFGNSPAVNETLHSHALVHHIAFVLATIDGFRVDLARWEQYAEDYKFLPRFKGHDEGKWFKGLQTYVAALKFLIKSQTGVEPGIAVSEEKLDLMEKVAVRSRRLACLMEIKYQFDEFSDKVPLQEMNIVMGQFEYPDNTRNMLNVNYTLELLRDFLKAYRDHICHILGYRHSGCRGLEPAE